MLSREEVARCREVLEAAAWADGRQTAGEQSARVKSNLQVPEGSAQTRELGDLILRALGRAPLFTSASPPLRVYPPMFNRYDVGMRFGAHVDDAIRFVPGTRGFRMRADVPTTLFLTDPDDYAGGELVVEDPYGTHSVKLPAGGMVVYPSTSLHRADEITRGGRWASWTQSMVKDDGKRAFLHDMDMAIIGLRQALPDDHPSVLSLTSGYNNLLRRCRNSGGGVISAPLSAQWLSGRPRSRTPLLEGKRLCLQPPEQAAPFAAPRRLGRHWRRAGRPRRAAGGSSASPRSQRRTGHAGRMPGSVRSRQSVPASCWPR